MSGGVALAEGLATGGQAVGGGLGLWGTLRFARWAVTFYFERRDLREARLNEREKALEKRYDARLSHLEAELHRTRRALMMIVNDTARKDSANPILQRVADMLGADDPNLDGPFLNRSIPNEPDEECEDLIGRLRDVPGTRRR